MSGRWSPTNGDVNALVALLKEVNRILSNFPEVVMAELETGLDSKVKRLLDEEGVQASHGEIISIGNQIRRDLHKVVENASDLGSNASGLAMLLEDHVIEAVREARATRPTAVSNGLVVN